MILAGSMSKGRVARVHDLRLNLEKLPDNVDPSRVKDNIIFIDVLKGRTIEEYTNQEMQKYIDEHDAKQKRKDRKIMSKYENYIDWHTHDKTMMKGVKEGEQYEWAHEFVFCYGNHEDYWHEYFDASTSEERKQEMYNEAAKLYKEQLEEFQERYPHLKVLLAVMHADEPNGSLHMHGIIQFQANEYERSLKTRVSVSRALEQDGFAHIQKTSDAKEQGFQMERLFKDFRHNVINKQILELGHEVKEEEHGAKHYDCPEYIKIMTEATEKSKEADRKMQEADRKLETINYLESEMKELDRLSKVDPVYSKDEIERVDIKVGGMFSKETKRVVQMPEDVFDSVNISADYKNLHYKTEEKIQKAEKKMEKYKDMMMNNKEKEMEKQIAELETKLEKAEATIAERDREIEKNNEMIRKLENFIDKVREIVRNFSPKLERLIWRTDEEQGWNGDDEFTFER